MRRSLRRQQRQRLQIHTSAQTKLTFRSDKPPKTPMAASDTPRDPESMIGVPSPLLDIQSRTFATARRGYDRAEVDAFLKRLAETISELLEERNVLSADAVADLDPEAIAESTTILEDAEARASRRLHAATLEADRLRTEARRTLDKAIKEAQEVENAARANAEQITAEAAEMRQQILRDLLRRRKEAQMHVEMLRAARDELLNMFSQVRRITAQVKDPLDSALDRAKQAADAAAKRTQEESQESLTQFEAELQTARLSGVIPIPVETEREVAPAEVAPAEAAPAEAGMGDTAPVDAAPVEELLPVSEDELPAAPEAVPANEPSVAIAAEYAEAQDGEDQLELSAPEPKLENIFARLRESVSHPETQSPEQQQSEAQAAPQSAKSGKSSKKKVSSKKKAKKKASGKSGKKAVPEMPYDAASEAATPDEELAPVPDAVSDIESSPDIAAADIPDAAPSVSDVQLEDLKRQIKRALTTDESKVLQAIHRLHKKAPKKAEELLSVLADRDARTEEFAQLLPAPPRDIQSLLVVPLAADLSACDIEEADTKTLVQQVRDVYRSFSQEQIAPAAAELAKHALEN